MQTVHEDLRKLLQRHSSLINNRGQLKNALRDLWKNKPLYVNLLIAAYDEKVLDAIHQNSTLDNVCLQRLKSRLSQNHGLSDQYAQWAVVTWFLAFEKRIAIEANIIESNSAEATLVLSRPNDNLPVTNYSSSPKKRTTSSNDIVSSSKSYYPKNNNVPMRRNQSPPPTTGEYDDNDTGILDDFKKVYEGIRALDRTINHGPLSPICDENPYSKIETDSTKRLLGKLFDL